MKKTFLLISIYREYGLNQKYLWGQELLEVGEIIGRELNDAELQEIIRNFNQIKFFDLLELNGLSHRAERIKKFEGDFTPVITQIFER